MSYICDICNKKTVKGRSQKHKRGVAGRRWKNRAQSTLRTFKPNLHKKTIIVNGEEKKVRVCAKCIKRIKKYGSIKPYKKVALG